MNKPHNEEVGDVDKARSLREELDSIDLAKLAKSQNWIGTVGGLNPYQLWFIVNVFIKGEDSIFISMEVPSLEYEPKYSVAILNLNEDTYNHLPPDWVPWGDENYAKGIAHEFNTKLLSLSEGEAEERLSNYLVKKL